MGRFKDQMTAEQIARCESEIKGIRALYSDDVILESASRIITAQTLDGDHGAINDFEARVMGGIQGQTLSIYEG